jgi:hypothetical protein
VRPDDPTTKATERNLQECNEEPPEQYAILGPPFIGHSGVCVRSRQGYALSDVFDDCRRANASRAIAAGASSGIANTELTLISHRT